MPQRKKNLDEFENYNTDSEELSAIKKAEKEALSKGIKSTRQRIEDTQAKNALAKDIQEYDFDI